MYLVNKLKRIQVTNAEKKLVTKTKKKNRSKFEENMVEKTKEQKEEFKQHIMNIKGIEKIKTLSLNKFPNIRVVTLNVKIIKKGKSVTEKKYNQDFPNSLYAYSI